MMTEIWKDVAGGEILLQVSNLGRVRSMSGQMRKVSFNRYAYVGAPIAAGGRKTVHVARMVYRTFVGQLADHDHIKHRDGDTHNCAADNLDVLHRTVWDPGVISRVVRLRSSGWSWRGIASVLGVSDKTARVQYSKADGKVYHHNRPWTECEIDYVLGHLSACVKQVARTINRTPEAVYAMRKRLRTAGRLDRPRKSRRLDEPEQGTIVRMYDAGEPVTEIARVLGRTESQIHWFIRRNRDRLPARADRRFFDKAEDKYLVEAAAAGATHVEMGQYLERTPNSVKQRLSRLRKRGADIEDRRFVPKGEMLATLEVLAATETVEEAAERLGVSKPVVYYRIRAMRKQK